MNNEGRFKGKMSEEYQLISLALPHFEELQAQVGKAVGRHQADPRTAALRVIDIGCGDGVTSHTILRSRGDVYLVCLDSEEEMIRQAEINLSEALLEKKCELVHGDALDYFEMQSEGSVHIVASALTLHNMQGAYRDELHNEIFRTLVPGGLFINADKYAPQDDNQRFKALGKALERFIEAYAPLGKIELLKDWVVHNVADQAPDRCMKEGDTIDILRSIGFVDLEILYRENMEAVLAAHKPV
jgi:ubiquinone/menaquinone biosynthesis C-methylase UbiE